nr:hypothetical protein [Tanacetum cinerariifolium]
MDDPNITMEVYIRLEEEKARRRAIVFNETLASEAALSCEPTVNSLNNDEINFRISFDEFDDEDCKVKMDDPNITMEEYIRLEEEKARRRAIVFNDKLTSDATLSCEPMVSSLNDEINFRISFDESNFRISFDESDNEDCTVIFDKNSFSYKIIFVKNMKTDSKNDNEKVSPEPSVSCFDDLDFFKDFENEFPAIVYNNAPTSKSDLLTKPTLSP